jgi:hypothetical protein
MTVSEVQERMSSQEFTAWLGYAQAFRMPQQRVEQGLKRVEVLLQHYLAMFANANKKKGKRAFKPDDFELKEKAPAEEKNKIASSLAMTDKEEEPGWMKIWKSVELIHAGIKGSQGGRGQASPLRDDKRNR